MNKLIATGILQQSTAILQQRKGNISVADLEAEVINNTCLVVIKRWKEREAMKLTFAEREYTLPIVKSFTDAAMELFPEKYTNKEANLAIHAVLVNVTWVGMWDFLREYFQKNHGIKIDDIETTSVIFESAKQKRYENTIFISESEVQRKINITYIGNSERILLSIEPTLSPKTGYLVERKDGQLQYKGYDPDYFFTINFDGLKKIETFILERKDKDLKIVYSN